VLIYAISVIGIIFAPASQKYFFEHLKGLIQLIYSTGLCLFFFLNIRQWSKKSISRLFSLFIIFILLGSFLELYTNLKIVSDNFRHAVFPGNLYETDIRDMFLYRHIRPKLFTSEPSHVAKFFVLATSIWYATSTFMRKRISIILIMVLGSMLIRSPITLVLFIFVSSFEIMVHSNQEIGFSNMFNRLILRNRLFFILFASTLIAVLFIILNQSKRIELVVEQRDQSFICRVIGPVLIAKNTVTRYPFFGIGITGKEAMADIIFDSYIDLGVRNNISVHSNYNFVSLFFCYYGLLGSFTFIVLLLCLMRSIEVNHKKFVFIMIIVFGFTMGAFVGLRTWMFIFSLFLISQKTTSVDHNKFVCV
jgi:hypothetical protein